jgi:Na+-transporting NADH:ubiquinone oxidoreductase subunit B
MGIFKSLLQKPLDSAEKLAQKGGPLAKFHYAIDSADTILRTPATPTSGKVHLRDALDSKRMMSTVILALTPLLIFSIWNAGFQRLSALGSTPAIGESLLQGFLLFLPMFLATAIAGGIVEVIFATIRGHEINEGFLVTLFLIPMTLPPGTPFWMVFIGTAFGIFFGKEVFGGTGMNFLNPALAARAFLFFSYPGAMSGDNVWTAVDAAKEKVVDGFSGATPLAVAASAPHGTDLVQLLADKGFTFQAMLMGNIPGSFGETSALLCLVGAVILVITGVGSWRVMVSSVVGALAMGALLNVIAGPTSSAFWSLPPYFHLVMGGFAFGAAFMATDPVSGAATETGKLIYGFLIGVLIVVIRVLNPAYPEGVMLAILLMNVFVPLVDHYVIESNVRRRLNRVR